MAKNCNSVSKTVDNNQSTIVQPGHFGAAGGYPMAFAGYSMNVLIGVIAKRLNIPFWTSKSSARVVRVLWFMRMMGDGWVSQSELADIGAGRWQTLRWTIPDGVKDGLIEEMQVDRLIKFKPTEAGKAFIIEADRYVIEEHQRSLSKIEAWKQRKRKRLMKTA